MAKIGDVMRSAVGLLATMAIPLAPAIAQPASSAVAAKPSTPPGGSAPLVRRAISPEGNAIAKRIMETPEPRMAEIRAESARLQEQKLQIAKAPNPDIDRLEQLIRREEALKAEIVKLVDDRFLGLLRALPAADRAVVLQNLANPVKLPGSGAPAGAATPGRPAPAKPAKSN